MEKAIEETASKILLQSEILSCMFGNPQNLSIFCFVCFDDGQKEVTHAERWACFDRVKTLVKRKNNKISDLKFVEFTREKVESSNVKSLEIHKFLNPRDIKKEIREVLHLTGWNGLKFPVQSDLIPNAKAFYFRKTTFKAVEGPLSLCLQNKTSITCFQNCYLKKAYSELITIPDFERIESTKLYPLQPKQDRLDDYKCPGLHPGPSMYDYVGEFERFWPHFHAWFPSPKGVLMHSYGQGELLPLLQNENIFSFEFDWLFWMSDKVIIFEVAMGKKPIGKKLGQVFTRHYRIFQILFHFFSSITSSNCSETFFKKVARFVIFFAGINHEFLSSQLCGAIKGSKSYIGNKDVLDCLYFAGNTNGQCKEDSFLKFDPTSHKMVDRKLESSALTTEEKELFDSLMCLFSLGYFTNRNDDVIQAFQQTPSCLNARYIKCQQRFMQKFLHDFGLNNDKSKFLNSLDIILTPQQFGIILDNPKFLFCPAEAGSGKTQLLLAKALESALDDDVDSIFFCIPEPKNIFRWRRNDLQEMILDFVRRNKFAFGAKFHIISDQKLLHLLTKTPRELQRTVLLVDEFLYGHEETFGLDRSTFYYVALKTFPFLKNCWLTNVTLHYLVATSTKYERYIPGEFCFSRPLNVQYRSANHISEFCSKLVQVNNKGKFSSPRVHGIFLSQQQAVEVKRFWTDSNQASSDDTFMFDLNSSLDKRYNSSRWIIVICPTAKLIYWNSWPKQKKLSDFNFGRITVFNSRRWFGFPSFQRWGKPFSFTSHRWSSR